VKLPNGDRAVVIIEKLRDYCLNDHHKDGQHKARVFTAALGMTSDDAEELRQLLLPNAAAAEAEPRYVNEHGARYGIDFEVGRAIGRRVCEVPGSSFTAKISPDSRVVTH
jgi:hypothetical protein